MKKQSLTTCLGLLPFLLLAQIITIADARKRPLGSTVTVQGIVTNGAELGSIRYLQDATAGIAAFPTNPIPAGFSNLTTGDRIEITGVLKNFNQLLEISPVTGFKVLSSQNPLPVPRVIQLKDVSDALESQLVELECIKFEKGGGLFSSVGNYGIFDSQGNTGRARIHSSASPVLGTSIPEESVRLTAILSQFKDDYQLLIRGFSDFNLARNCFYLVQQPQPIHFSTNSITVEWLTSLTGKATLKYGETPQLGNEVAAQTNGYVHTATLSNLDAGKIYWVQAHTEHNGELIVSNILPMATVSNSTGEVKVFFNHPVDLSVGAGVVPDGQSPDVVLHFLLNRIQNAQKTIDVAMYNNDRIVITNALKEAHARGVRVRYIAARDANSPALQPPPAFPVVYGNDEALMHNKFVVIDADDSQHAWVITGSTNWTNGNMNKDFNNTVAIQDQSLARTYQLEMDEMWGSSMAQPNPALARFGASKRDNTPHLFLIGGRKVECYFSPSDQTTAQIERVVQSADFNLQFALLTFTKNELGEAIINKKLSGIECRGIIDNINDSGSEYNHLISNGVSVARGPGNPMVHHKYLVVDALHADALPVVLTGSHNWSQTAENSNDENTLIFWDATLSTMFLQDFSKMYKSYVASHHTDNPAFKLYPNPVSDFLYVQFDDADNTIYGLELQNLWGATVFRSSDVRTLEGGIDTSGLPAGMFFLKIVARDGTAVVPFQKI